MQTITLYRYIRHDDGVSTSPVKPDTAEYTVEYRLIADDGKALTDGTNVVGCIYVESSDGWIEIDAPDKWREDVQRDVDAIRAAEDEAAQQETSEQDELADMKAALEILGVSVDG